MAITRIHRHRGFTVIELIVMISVIAILATITFFAFGSWRSQTATTEVKGALIHLSSALDNERTFNSAYPATVPSSYEPSGGVTISYALSGATYCASGTSTAVSSVVWYISGGSSTPTQTPCS